MHRLAHTPNLWLCYKLSVVLFVSIVAMLVLLLLDILMVKTEVMTSDWVFSHFRVFIEVSGWQFPVMATKKRGILGVKINLVKNVRILIPLIK